MNPATFNPPSRPTLSLPSTMNRKPKLSLNTNTTCQQRTLGRGSTGLRLDTRNVSSPTSQNTCRNVFQSPGSLAVPALEEDTGSASTPFPRLKLKTTRLDRNNKAFASLSPTSARSSPVTLLSPTIPYEHPSNLRSILRNGPGSSARRRRDRRRPSTAPSFVLPTATPQPSEHTQTFSEGVLALANKRVCFQQPLAIDIETTTYTMRHSDLPSRSPSQSPTSNSQDEEEVDEGYEEDDSQRPSSSSSSASSSASTNTSSSSYAEEDASSASSPDTPEQPAQLRKREREWVWTLGPLNRPGDDSAVELQEDEEAPKEESRTTLVV